jgi:sugar lactone lactonase YvrE
MLDGLRLGLAVAAAALAHAATPAAAASFSTLVTAPFAIEGLASDQAGNLYTAGRNPTPGEPCPVWRVRPGGPAALELVGTIPAPCSPAGLAFDASGTLFVTNSPAIYSLRPDAGTPPVATLFASGVPGTNGLAFDRDGDLWTGDGTTGQGRVWRIRPCGAPPCAAELVFRVQPMRNSVALGGSVEGDGVGRQNRSFPPGTPANTLGAQDLVANGLAFGADGRLFVADTARGAIWVARLGRRGELRSRTGCDTTFSPDTLCAESLFVAHPLLEGADGIALDRAGAIWVAVNERNAIVVVSRRGRVREVFRNAPDASTSRRNGGPLEFPTSPVLVGRTLCTANTDADRRDNSPASAGELAPTGPARGKISCLHERLRVPGVPLP